LTCNACGFQSDVMPRNETECPGCGESKRLAKEHIVTVGDVAGVRDDNQQNQDFDIGELSRRSTPEELRWSSKRSSKSQSAGLHAASRGDQAGIVAGQTGCAARDLNPEPAD
jgi:hypothetical protein